MLKLISLLLYLGVCGYAVAESHTGVLFPNNRQNYFPESGRGISYGVAPCGVGRAGGSFANYGAEQPLADLPVTRISERTAGNRTTDVASGDKGDCAERMDGALNTLKDNYGDLYNCRVKVGERIIFEEASDSWCNSWDQKTGIRTTKGCGRPDWKDFAAALIKHTCITNPISSGATLQCGPFAY